MTSVHYLPDVQPEPPGLNSPIGTNRRPLYRVYSGDTLEIRVPTLLPDGSPATEGNSYVDVFVRDDRFGPVVWSGGWASGVVPVAGYPGVAAVRIPPEATGQFRRGSFIGSVRLASQDSVRTVAEFSILVEYAASSPHRDIPYKKSVSGELTDLPTDFES